MPTQRRRPKHTTTAKSEKDRDIKVEGDHPANHSHLSYIWLLFPIVAVVVVLGTAYKTLSIHPQDGTELASGLQGFNDSDLFKVVDLPGRGKGVIATRDIRQGELIIREKPLFVVPHHVTSSPAALISQSLLQATPSGRQAFLDLSYVNFPKNWKPENHPDEVALAIFQTNAVAAGDGVGIFPRMARLNHGCSSAFNVVYTWREWEKTLVVYALKSIRKGEELLTTYTNTKRPRDQRRAFLEEHYGFFCTCAVCSLSEEQSHASDKRLQAISDQYERFATWGARSISGKEAIRIVRDIWKLEDEEGYWSERGRLAADAAWVAASHSDAAATGVWAEIAIEWYTYELGGDSQHVQEIIEAAKDPQRHSAWGSREPQEVGGPVLNKSR